MELSGYYLTSRIEIGDFVGLIMVYGLGFGIAIVGLGVMVRGVSSSTGAAISRFGGMLALLSAALFFAQGFALQYGVHDMPVWLFWILAVVVGLKVMQILLGLIFGRDVGTRVTAGLISAILAPLGALLSGFVDIVRRAFRR